MTKVCVCNTVAVCTYMCASQLQTCAHMCVCVCICVFMCVNVFLHVHVKDKRVRLCVRVCVRVREYVCYGRDAQKWNSQHPGASIHPVLSVSDNVMGQLT